MSFAKERDADHRQTRDQLPETDAAIAAAGESPSRGLLMAGPPGWEDINRPVPYLQCRSDLCQWCPPRPSA